MMKVLLIILLEYHFGEHPLDWYLLGGVILWMLAVRLCVRSR